MSTTATAPQPTKVVTGRVRFSYLHVFEPSSIGDDGDAEKKYSASLIISKDDKEGLAKIRAAIGAALEIAKGKNKGKIPPNFKMPLRDGDVDRPEDEAYANSFFLNCSSKTKPTVLDRNGEKITDEDEFYSGCFGRASINFYYFDVKANRGIAAGLNHLQKTKDGEPLGGRASAENDFADPIDFDDEDDLLG